VAAEGDMRQSVQWGVVALLLSSPVAAGDAAGPADATPATQSVSPMCRDDVLPDGVMSR
jgi:hypothetical protein